MVQIKQIYRCVYSHLHNCVESAGKKWSKPFQMLSYSSWAPEDRQDEEMSGIPGRGSSMHKRMVGGKHRIETWFHKGAWGEWDRLQPNQGVKGCEMKVLNKGMKGTGLYLWTIHQRGLEERKLGTIPSLFLLFILGTLHLAMGPLLAHEVHRAKAPMWPYLHENKPRIPQRTLAG